MKAMVFGFGEYHEKIVELMPYPESWYENVPEGKRVCGQVAYAGTTDESKLLAKCLGVDIDSMNWQVSPHRISTKPAREEGNERIAWSVKELKMLTKWGWRLFFDPCA